MMHVLPMPSTNPFNHRRYPSAPPVVVHSTKTPGLLSLSKPPRPSPPPRSHRIQQHRPSPRQPVPASEQQQSQQPRRRHRQPSPQQPSQAEASSDPFLVLSPTPSGKLAKRRQHSPAQPKAIPVPVPVPTVPTHVPRLSRSVPVPAARAWDAFPICDDMTEPGDLPPVTPTRLRTRTAYDSPPRTAPLHYALPQPSAAYAHRAPAHPTTPSPPARKGRKHRRTPSDGVFHMSSDEELSTPAPPVSAPAPAPAPPQLPRSRARAASVSKLPTTPTFFPGMRTPTREQQLEREAAAAAAAASYFASSMFQNSPSPDELPDPMFA